MFCVLRCEKELCFETFLVQFQVKRKPHRSLVNNEMKIYDKNACISGNSRAAQAHR